MPDNYLGTNRANWDERVPVHVASALYDVEGFKAGRSSLARIERDELGPYIHAGTTLLHLQCHFGLDTLSWARAGATVTGVDFSGAAIAQARALAEETGLADAASFVHSAVERAPAVLDGTFDVVFSSWGALNWLGDLERWAQVVAGFVRPGGVFYLAEFHPYLFTLADDCRHDSLRIGYPYFQYGEPLRFDEPGSYADPDAATAHNVTYEWTHGFAEVIDPLLRNGLRLEHLHEFPSTCAGLVQPFLEADAAGELRMKGHRDDFPLSYSLLMTREDSP